MKAAALPATVANAGRLAHAKVRAHVAARFAETTVAGAITHAASELRRIIHTHGPDSVAFYGSGQLASEDYYVLAKLVKGFLGTDNLDTNSRLCMASAVSGYKTAFGADAPPGSYADIDEAEVFLILGANVADCHPILFRRIEKRLAAAPDARPHEAGRPAVRGGSGIRLCTDTGKAAPPTPGRFDPRPQPRGSSSNGTSRSRRGSRGSPSTRSAATFFCTSSVPPAMCSAGAPRN